MDICIRIIGSEILLKLMKIWVWGFSISTSEALMKVLLHAVLFLAVWNTAGCAALQHSFILCFEGHPTGRANNFPFLIIPRVLDHKPE